MLPYFRLEANGTNITNKVKDRLLSLTLTDNSGIQNDRLTLELDDRPPHISLVAMSTKFRLWLGYLPDGDADPDYQSMVYVGTYFVDEFQVGRQIQHTLSVTARANDTGGTLKTIKTRSWANTTLGGIVKHIAGEHDLTPKIEKTIAATVVKHLEQSAQSDQGFLTRLAVSNDGIFKVVDGNLFFSPRSNDLSVSGKKITITEMDESELSQWALLTQQRSNHSAVAVRYYDSEAGQEKTVISKSKTNTVPTSLQRPSADSKHTETQPPEVAQDEPEAQALATATNNQLQREKETLTFTCIGNPALRAETKVIIKGMREGVSDTWLITTATHTLSSAGYTTSVQCESVA